MNKIHHLRPEWRIHPLTAKEYAQRHEMSLSNQVSDFEGQIFVSVYYDSRDPNLHEQGVAQSLKDLAETFGDLKLFHAVPTGQDNVSDFLIEFFDTRDSENAVVTLNGTSVNVRYVKNPHHYQKTDIVSELFIGGQVLQTRCQR